MLICDNHSSINSRVSTSGSTPGVLALPDDVRSVHLVNRKLM